MELSKEKWIKIEHLPLSTLQNLLIGKTIDIKASCEIMRNFYCEKAIVYKMELGNNNQEVILYIKSDSGSYKIGGNTNGLSCRLSL